MQQTVLQGTMLPVCRRHLLRLMSLSHKRTECNNSINNKYQKCFNPSRAFSVTSVSLSKIEVSYFNEFYEAVKREADTVRKDETLTRWQKMSDDPEQQQRALNRWTFLKVVEIYIEKNPINRRGHCEFIRDAMERMKDLGVHRDIRCYKALFLAFPRGEMETSNMWQEFFRHYPKQQDLAVEIMDRMSMQGVIPDQDFAQIVASVFGTKAQAFLKVRRMLYWMPKFRNMNPYRLPHDLPSDAVQLALLALKKMVVDLKNVNTVWQIHDEGLNNKETFAASAQSPEQQELLGKHPENVPLYVEGGYLVWLRHIPQTYFILRAEADPTLFNEMSVEEEREEEENIDDIKTMFDDEETAAELAPILSKHHQQDGTIFAMCITGTKTKESLIAWIRELQKTNPVLEKTPIVFTLRTPEDDALIEADAHELVRQA